MWCGLANQIVRFSFFDECQRAFDPDYTTSTAISSPATSSSSPSQQRSNRPMVIPNGDLDNDDDVSLMSTPTPSRESSPATALYSFSSSTPQRSSHLTIQTPNDDSNHDNDSDDDTGYSDSRDNAREPCANEQPNSRDTTPRPSKALNNENSRPNRKVNQDRRSRLTRMVSYVTHAWLIISMIGIRKCNYN